MVYLSIVFKPNRSSLPLLDYSISPTISWSSGYPPSAYVRVLVNYPTHRGHTPVPWETITADLLTDSDTTDRPVSIRIVTITKSRSHERCAVCEHDVELPLVVAASPSSRLQLVVGYNRLIVLCISDRCFNHHHLGQWFTGRMSGMVYVHPLRYISSSLHQNIIASCLRVLTRWLSFHSNHHFYTATVQHCKATANFVTYRYQDIVIRFTISAILYGIWSFDEFKNYDKIVKLPRQYHSQGFKWLTRR